MWHEAFEEDGELIIPRVGERRRVNSLASATRPRLGKLLVLLERCGWACVPCQVLTLRISSKHAHIFVEQCQHRHTVAELSCARSLRSGTAFREDARAEWVLQ